MKNELLKIYPFNLVMTLYQLKLKADQHNDIELRSLLLKQHPYLFDKEALKELGVYDLQRQQLKKRKTNKVRFSNKSRAANDSLHKTKEI